MVIFEFEINPKHGGKFSGALTENEWASFYLSIMKSNQRNYFRVGDNGILISDNTNPLNYKLVCYEGGIDKGFIPKSVSPILLNQDGTPKTFYHSTNEIKR